MATTKRVNMDIDSELWKSVKKAAIDQDIELREWVTQALRRKLDYGQCGKTQRKCPQIQRKS